MNGKSLFAVLLLVVVLGGLSRADIPKGISYQGKVTDSGGAPVADGNYTMRFRLYDAETSGSLLWDSGNQTVPVSGGIFSVILGESPMPSIELVFDDDYWLQVRFNGVDQSPRQRLASVGYAYMASGVVAGTQVYGSVTSGSYAALQAINQASTGATYGLNARSLSTAGSGVYGEAMSSSGTNNGVYGRTASSSGRGVYGEASYGEGTTYGVYGYSASVTGSGVYGEVGGGAQANYGVYGTSASASGRGVFGGATSTIGTTYGVYGTAISSGGYGVYGLASASTGLNIGVYATTYSDAGYGVYGKATATSGTTYGGYFQCASASGHGVHAKNTAATGSAYGVFGWSESTEGHAVQGLASAASGTTYGVYGAASSSEGRGVYGIATRSHGTNYGVYGESGSTWGRGVYGKATATSGATYGVMGYHNSTEGAAGWFYADNNASSSTAAGVYGRCDADGLSTLEAYGVAGHAYYRGIGVGAWSHNGEIFRGYDGHYGSAILRYYFLNNGWACADGGWSSFLTGKDGSERFIYAMESPEVWVEDFGTAAMTNGRSSVVIARDFAESVSTDRGYHVFLTPLGPSEGLYVAAKAPDHFEVRSSDASAGVSFDYRIVARRAGLEGIRMTKIVPKDKTETAEEPPALE